LDYIFSKTNSAPTTTMTNNSLSLPEQEVHSIFQLWKPLNQSPKTNSMSPEGIPLFFTNFPLGSVSQHNANSIAIFRHNIYFHQYNFPAFLSISLRFVDRQ